MSSLCGGDGGAVILPLAEEVAASGAPEPPLLADNKVGGRWRVGDLVSVWSNSERSWNDGWVVAAAAAATAAVAQNPQGRAVIAKKQIERFYIVSGPVLGRFRAAFCVFSGRFEIGLSVR